MAFENLNKSGIRYLLGKLKDIFVQDKDAVKSVNGVGPGVDGNITVTSVQFAQNIQSESANINSGTFIDRTAGGNASINTGNAWLMKMTGNMRRTGYVAESLNMTVRAMAQETPITATISRDTFVAYVAQSGTITLTFTTAWSADPTLYGITVTGTPVAGDQIEVVYVKEERGVITVSNPQSLTATGWNLYNHSVGYARVLKYSDQYGYKISGAYSAIQFSSTIGGMRSSVTVDNGAFTVPSDGYIWVTDGNETSTAIWMTWADWTEQANGGVFAAYTESSVDLSDIMSEYFPYGLLSTGTVYDEIDLNVGQAINRVDRLTYSAENRATAKASGREYTFDEDYIYLAKGTPVTTGITLSGEMTANDHGLEIISGTDIGVTVQLMYGANLKNKLERDVLTISQQALTAAQISQIHSNLGLTRTMGGMGLFSGTTLNDATTPGMYWVPPTVSGGLPDNMSANYAVLNVFTVDSGSRLQMLTPYDGANGVRRVFYRIYINGQWYPWSLYRSNTCGNYSGSLNSLKTEGSYWVAMSAISGYPSGVSSGASGIIEVMDSGYNGTLGSRMMQKLYVWVGANSAIQPYYRMLVNNTWTPWTT